MKWVIDAGHGGTMFGHYMTAGKRSPEVPPGIFEGEFNRIVARIVCQSLKVEGIAAVELTPGPIPTPISIPIPGKDSRLSTVKKICGLEPDVALVSIHANASGSDGWDSASGARMFIHKKPAWGSRDNYDKSVLLAAAMMSEFDKNPNIPYGVRSTVEYNYAILKVPCPAVLVECGFMTCRVDAEFMASVGGKAAIADSITDAILSFEGSI